MKTAVLNIKNVPVMDKCYPILGDMMKDSSTPAGVYENRNGLFSGLLVKDCQGNVSYLDRGAGLIYPFDEGIWANDFFVRCNDIEKITLKFV
jgi:hypothetical protein